MPLQIEPVYRSRFTFEEIRATYATPEAAWDAGDFVLASETAPEGSELRACATIMSGFIVQGLERLEQCRELSPRGLLIKAFALWQLDRNAEALAEINRIPSTHDMALRLRQLIEAPEVRVIITATVMPLFTQRDDRARDPVQRYGQFKLSYYATQLARNAWSNDLNDPFDTLIDGLGAGARPDFIFTMTPQWLLPRNFERIDVPRVLWCHDTDVFFNRVADNLSVHDVRLMCTSQEHFELQSALGRPCMSSILTETMCMPFPKARLATEKDIDVLFTGAALHVLHSEKPRFLYQLAALSPRYRIHVVDGHIRESEYFDLLARSRFLPVVNRYSGQPSPRWSDALAQSCCVLYPSGSGYANVGAGCFPYRETDIAGDIARHIEAHRAAQPGSPYHPATVYADTNRYFALRQQSRGKNMERLLKMAAFAALVWRFPQSGPHARTHASPRPQSVWMTPPIDRRMFARDDVEGRIKRHVDGLASDAGWRDSDYNNAAAINMHLAVLSGDTFSRSLRQRAYALLDEGLGRFPQSLLLRFNAAHWRFFDSGEGETEAVSRFRQLIADFDTLAFSPTNADIGLPVTYYDMDRVVPYYDYCQLVLCAEVLAHADVAGRESISSGAVSRVILAAAHGFIGLAAERRGELAAALESYRRSLAIYPDNLPLMRTRLSALCRLVQSSAADPRFSEELTRAVTDCAAKYPSILLSSPAQIVAALERLDRSEDIKDLLAMWYRLASVTSSGSATWFNDGIEEAAMLARYESLFPDELRTHLDLLTHNPPDRERASQFEILMHAATDRRFATLLGRRLVRPLRRATHSFGRVQALYRTVGLAQTSTALVRWVMRKVRRS